MKAPKNFLSYVSVGFSRFRRYQRHPIDAPDAPNETFDEDEDICNA